MYRESAPSAFGYHLAFEITQGRALRGGGRAGERCSSGKMLQGLLAAETLHCAAISSERSTPSLVSWRTGGGPRIRSGASRLLASVILQIAPALSTVPAEVGFWRHSPASMAWLLSASTRMRIRSRDSMRRVISKWAT